MQKLDDTVINRTQSACWYLYYMHNPSVVSGHHDFFQQIESFKVHSGYLCKDVAIVTPIY